MPVFPHDLRAGSDVYSSDGHKLGELHRVVLKRADLSISHVVVDIGFLRSGRPIWQGGFGLDYDHIVLVEQVESATPERLQLSVSAEDFKDTPEYTAEYYESPYNLTPERFDVPDVVTRLQHLSDIVNSTSSLWLYERLNKPADSVNVSEGADVWRREPHEKLGDITRLLFNDAGELQALVISRGFVFKHESVLPLRFIAEIYDEVIHVDISDREIEQLKAYESE